jgi:aspartate/methionine/tyrosine aminotransferase
MSHWPPGTLLGDWGAPEPADHVSGIAAAKAAGLTVRDFIGANPQEHGFEFDQVRLAAAISKGVASAARYAPDSRGLPAAREAVARHRGDVSSDNILLTPGTSFGYFIAFRLLGENGGEVLCPSPTYPLFADLCRIAGVRLRRYHLSPPGRPGDHWTLDPAEIRFQLTPRTRAIVIVAPHNPTGHSPSNEEWREIAAIAREHGLALIVDEVFRDIAGGGAAAPRASAQEAPLVIELDGLSKMLSLPAMKAAWMAVTGDADETRRFLHAAEYLLDSFLPMSDYLQASIPALLDAAQDFVPELARRYAARRRDYERALIATGWETDAAMGGVYVLLRKGDATIDAPSTARRLLAEHGIIVHPGEFYELPAGYLVATCVRPDPEALASALRQLG